MKKNVLILAICLLFSTQAFSAMRLSGSSASTVQLLVYGDYYCPFTKRFILYFPELIDEFGEDLSILYAHFPLRLREPGIEAALAAECAHQQGLGLPFSIAMAETNSLYSVDDYAKLVSRLGIRDLSGFGECYREPSLREDIITEFQTGRAVGVSGTPNIFINGELVRGAYPIEHFQELIREAL